MNDRTAILQHLPGDTLAVFEDHHDETWFAILGDHDVNGPTLTVVPLITPPDGPLDTMLRFAEYLSSSWAFRTGPMSDARALAGILRSRHLPEGEDPGPGTPLEATLSHLYAAADVVDAARDLEEVGLLFAADAVEAGEPEDESDDTLRGSVFHNDESSIVLLEGERGAIERFAASVAT